MKGWRKEELKGVALRGGLKGGVEIKMWSLKSSTGLSTSMGAAAGPPTHWLEVKRKGLSFRLNRLLLLFVLVLALCCSNCCW